MRRARHSGRRISALAALERPDGQVAAALAVEALGLCPREHIGLDAVDANAPLRRIDADHLDRALRAPVAILPLGTYRGKMQGCMEHPPKIPEFGHLEHH